MLFARPELIALRPLRHRRRRPHPQGGPGDHRRQPPLVLRRHGDEHAVRPRRAHRPLPRQEGGVRRAAGRARSRGRWAASGSTGAPGSDEPLREAAAALEAGELVAIMPQGTIPRGEAFFDPVLKGRWGAARLAHLTKAPVIPVGLWGTEKVWPRSRRLPNVLNVANPPEVRVRVGAPVSLKYKSVPKDTERIMEAIVELLPPEARKHHTPTAAGAGPHLPARLQGQPGQGARPPSRHRLMARWLGMAAASLRPSLAAPRRHSNHAGSDDVQRRAGVEPLDLLGRERLRALEVDHWCRRACGSGSAPARRARASARPSTEMRSSSPIWS